MTSQPMSPLLAEPGAVAADAPDVGVAAHYGDPYAEQRALAAGWGVVDASHRPVLKITGADRLSWLHSLSTQHLERLAPGESAQTLILSPQGHVQYELTLTDDGDTTWAHVEPGTSAGVLEFLISMRFMLAVEAEDVSSDYAVLTVQGPAVPAELASPAAVRIGTDAGTDLILARDSLVQTVADLRSAGAALAG